MAARGFVESSEDRSRRQSVDHEAPVVGCGHHNVVDGHSSMDWSSTVTKRLSSRHIAFVVRRLAIESNSSNRSTQGNPRPYR